MSKCAYMALDPGHTTGWAAFNDNGDLITMDQVTSREAVYALLDEWSPPELIVEDWITKQAVNLGGDRLVTVRIIGWIECWAFLNKAKIHMQPNTIKSIGYMWAGIKKAKSHSQSHYADAYVHGVFFLQKNGIRKPQQGKAPA